ncbi:glycoprotein [Drosophila sturtevanti sigmavirus]|uniref:Glycoprotein n=1 Tax=Drosophila sturtevanti sigmavirus TaxID=1802946 RepID=A0A140D8M8_9RHAB|nr:glycoprotein [Drosophila sturtevanti sigmavirus]AMK09252.1 glycoprotein [Drosophila sturtevanti sigmavirus]
MNRYILPILMSALLTSGMGALLPGAFRIDPGTWRGATEFEPGNERSKLVFPVYDRCPWKPVDLNQLKCPVGGQVYPGLENPSTLSMPLSRPFYKDTQRYGGYLCTKYRLTTTCESNWAAVETVTHMTQHIPIQVSECLKANMDKEGVDHKDILEHPLKDCSWWTTKSVYKDHITVEDHPVKYDPYMGKYVDKLFPSGYYMGPGINCVQPSKVWIPLSSADPAECAHFQNVQGTIYFKAKTEITPEEIIKAGILWTDVTREKKFEHACSMQYCGHPGIRFQDGEFFSLIPPDNMISFTTDLLNSLPVCNPDLIIKLQDPFEEGHFSSNVGLAEIFLMKCHDTVSKLRNCEPVSQVDVSYLGQNFPGHGLAYKWVNGTLYDCMVDYIVGYLGDNNKKIILSHGGTKNHIPAGYVYTDWSQGAKGDISIGPNGMMNITGVIHIPIDTLFREYIHDELTREIGFHNVTHPDLRPIVDISPEDIEWIEQAVTAKTGEQAPGLVGYVKGHWHTWAIYVYVWIGLMGGGLVLYLLLAYPELRRFLKVTFICLFGWIYLVPKGCCYCVCCLTKKLNRSVHAAHQSDQRDTLGEDQRYTKVKFVRTYPPRGLPGGQPMITFTQ